MDELATLIENILQAQTDEARAAALAGVDLDATETQLQSAADGLLAGGDDSDETIETLEAIRDSLNVIRSAKASAAAADAEKAGRRAALAAEIGGEVVEGGDVDGGDVVEGDHVEGDKVVPAPPAETGDDAATKEGEGETALAAQPPKRPQLSALRDFTPAEAQAPVEEKNLSNVKITAQIDVPGFTVGTSFSQLREVAEAFIARRGALGNTRGDSIAHEKAPIVHVDYLDELVAAGPDAMLNGLMLMDAGRDGGGGNSLTASGGFGAPAQVIYNFVKVNRPCDLVQDFLPVVGAPRGSIEFPTSPDIRDAFTGNLAKAYSNAEDTAGVHKTTAIIAAPAFNTCTVGAEYVILQFGNLGSRAYPEWVEHWIGLAMDVHAHKVSQKLMLQMMGASGVAVPTGPNGGATATLFSNFSLAAADMRHDLRMCKDDPLEMVVPAWTNGLIRSDLARARKGSLDSLNVSDEAIASWFAVRNIRPHYVEDWFDIDGSATTGASVWPSGFDFLLYPPGTFIKLDMGTLDLGVVRDSTLNATNDYNIFVETFESACKIGIESRLYSVSICANGAFSADQNLNCAGLDIPGS